MKKLLLLILTSISLSMSQSVVVGGSIPLISNISCQQGNVFPEYSDTEGLLATCILNNNSPEYAIDFYAESDSIIKHFTIVGSDVEGTLGGGIIIPEVSYIGQYSSYTYTWAPGPQTTATTGYVIRIYGYLKKNSSFRLITTIHNNL